ncbi:Prenyltransferase and squalene oxidase repeat protein [Gimesia panareensis]|uniref:Prenyltransferase and squalene oxidase repeat protein n=1 Tax=Gimesia panareensis TaxID=2527978 RepID=A0A518FJV5_9PLAN|nr:prenyltransferase/squalene oxidase repeat-containing protein [Gimesia panareensis]QDV16573.1 Prenyltransferase and squalene oxidase repeat protein [Gimesia panareensis]
MRRHLLSSVCFVFSLGAVSLISASTLQAQTDQEVTASRLKGIEFLKSQQQEDGSWEFEGHPVGITALCTLALLENGIPVSDPVIQKGRAFVVKESEKLNSTYDLALAILLLSRIGDREDKLLIRRFAARLIAGQSTTGGWSYTCPLAAASSLNNPRGRLKLGTSPGDNSCTQFAVLGLWTASRSNVNIDDSMSGVARRFVETQNEDGGWPYKLATDDMKEPSRNSMTLAGLFCLTVARATKIRSLQEEQNKVEAAARGAEQKEGDTLVSDPIFAKGLEMAGKYAAGISASSARYFLWSTERVGVLLGLEKLGDTDWFSKGAAALIATQKEDGSWEDSRGKLADTSFAILFLRKANLGSDISRMLNGEPAKKFQIHSQAKKPEFDSLEAAIAAAKPGDLIRVNGDGPFRIPHVTVDKDLSIEAGFGYSPVFEYARGRNKLGLRARPERDPNVRHILQVTKGTLALEGIRFEFDPPEVGKDVPWVAIKVDGGNLRMLNCSVSEQNDKGMAAVQFTRPTNSSITNSFFVGGRAAFEIEGTGKQTIDVDESVIFSRKIFSVLKSPEKSAGGSINLNLSRCTIQGIDGFVFERFVKDINVKSDHCAWKVENLGLSMLSQRGAKTDRSYTGEGNVYDVDAWLGLSGTADSSVKDLKSWNSFWGNTDETSLADTLAFNLRRVNTSFNHRYTPADWELSETSRVAAQVTGLGARTSNVGAGAGFSRFRSSILYNEWKEKQVAEAK